MGMIRAAFLSGLGFCLLSAPSLLRAQNALQLVPVPPCRLIDTRLTGGPITGGQSRTFNLRQLAQAAGCSSLSSASAYSLNVTVVPSGRLGFLTIWPTGQSRPTVSLMNSLDGRIKADAAIVGAGTNGSVDVYVNNTASVLLDINGFFEPATFSALMYYPLPPCRVIDTRNADGDLGGPFLTANHQRDFPVLAESSCLNQTDNVLAYSFNVTAVPHPTGQRLGFLSVWPTGQPRPTVSTLNNTTGTIVANAAIVPAGTNGSISVYPNNNTDLLIDITGYFAPPTGQGLSLYALAPCRAVDTRPHPYTGEKAFDIHTSPCAPPNTTLAYVLNATALPHGRLGYLTLWPNGQPQPDVSTLNAVDGAYTSNMAIVGPVNNGSIDTYAANGTTDLLLDLSGYFAALPTIQITTTFLPGGTTEQPYSAQLDGSGGEPPYTWSLVSGSLPPGLTLNSTGLISGIPTAGGTFLFEVQLSDALGSNTSAQLSITVSGGTLMITTASLPNGTATVPYSAALGVAGGTPPYTWSIVSGNLPAGLHLNPSSGVISGTPSTAGISNFTVQVQDSQSLTAQSALQLTINPAITNALLSGHYAFAFSGYANGNPVVMAGAVVADGNGNLTSGVLDYNDGTGEALSGHDVVAQTLTTGSSYSLTANGLGTVTVVTNLGTYKFSVVVLANACSSNAQFLSTCGRLIQRDSSNPQNYGSGVLKVQNPQYFPVDTFFPGNFSLLISGSDPHGSRYAGAGALGTNSITFVDIDCSNSRGGTGWGLDGCPSDINDAGAVASNPIKGTFSATIDQATGRGNFADFTFPHDPNGICTGSSVCNYAFYVIDKQEMMLISADPISHPANLTLWWAYRQNRPSGGWSLSSLNGASITELSAQNTHGPDVTLGSLIFDGAGNGTLNSDENNAGALSLGQSSQGGYAVDSSGQKTGRMTLSGFSTQFGSAPPVLYMIAPNTAFAVGTDTKVTSGMLEAQTGAPFSDASVIGTYAGGSASPVLSTVVNSVTSLLGDGAGNISAAQETSGPGGPTGPDNLALTYQVDSTGRALVQQGGNQFGVLYVVSPTKFVLLPVGDLPVLNVFASGPTN